MAPSLVGPFSCVVCDLSQCTFPPFDLLVVSLVAAGGTTYAATLTEVDSFTQITASFDLTGVPEGVYSVRVTRPDGLKIGRAVQGKKDDRLIEVGEQTASGQGQAGSACQRDRSR